MATINLGNIKFNWKGAYNGATAYVVDDVVEYNGSSYICILASTGNLPTNATYWETMAEGGDVATTLTTQGDILYRDGSGLQRLAAGTSGQYLETQGAGANPQWSTVTSAILQMKSVSTGVKFSTATQTYTATSATEYTPLTLAITPTSNTSLLKVDYSIPAQHNGDYMGMMFLTYNHSGISETSIENDDTYGATHMFDRDSQSATNVGTGIAGTVYIDPQTTNEVTVKFRFATSNSSNTTYINRTVNNSGADDSGAAIATVTISEIAGNIITHTKGLNIAGD